MTKRRADPDRARDRDRDRDRDPVRDDRAPASRLRARTAAERARTRRGRPTGAFTQHRRLDRLRTALENNPGGLGLHEIATLLHVTTRSVRRYLAELQLVTGVESVAPVPGGAHVWRIKPRELGRVVAFRRTQAYGLLAARAVFDAMRGSALYDEVDVALRQVLQVAQRPGRTGATRDVSAENRLDERLLYVPHPARSHTQRGEELDDLFHAVADLREITFRHRIVGGSGGDGDGAGSSPEPPERVRAQPYAMLLYRGAVVFVARDVDRDEIRVFPFDRTIEIAARDERFALPADFDVRAYVHGEFGIAPPGRRRVLVELDARVADEIRARKLHPSQKVATAPDGRVRLAMTLPLTPELRRWILAFGDAARVLEPSDLAADVEAALARAATHYRA